jgi:hypothetical protein
MKNKELALNKLEQVEGAVNNLKSSAYRGQYDDLEQRFERVTNLLEDLRNLISIEKEQFLTGPHQGL